MKKVDVGYAVIYVDDQNELSKGLSSYFNADRLSIDEVIDEVLEDIFEKNDIITDYYKTPGSIQWNYYFLYSLPEELKKYSSYIDDNDKYARKIQIDMDEVKEFVEENFPIYKKDDRKVKLYINSKHISWDNFVKKYYKNDSKHIINSSYLREFNEMNTLEAMDQLRSEFIFNGLISTIPKNIVYFTHIKQDAGWFQKKFSFLGDNFEIIDLSLKKETNEI